MISLLLLPLLLLPSIQGQTCDMDGLEERLARMEDKCSRERMEKRMEERVEERVKEVDEKMRKELDWREAELRNELASKEEMGSAVIQGLRYLPYLTVCAYKRTTTTEGTITYDSFTTNFNNNGDLFGVAGEGQLDLGTGVFNCLHDGIYRVTFSGLASLERDEAIDVYVSINGVLVPESRWLAYTIGTIPIGGGLRVPGSRSLMLPLKLGDTLELRTRRCTGGLGYLVLCIELGFSTRPY